MVCGMGGAGDPNAWLQFGCGVAPSGDFGCKDVDMIPSFRIADTWAKNNQPVVRVFCQVVVGHFGSVF